MTLVSDEFRKIFAEHDRIRNMMLETIESSIRLKGRV